MKQRIIDELKRVEQSYGVKIVYAVGSGSRAWGFPSQDSDYDVRFIYVPKKEWYFSIEQERDVIEEP
ncbi:DNA polymerase beta superfamily protein, partial [Staphylococcus aureus]|uniref:DNA polymerase beta superfamily protein n=1 Tax=Staphylococcus aureus TaxID=1280 RepID=UPI001E34FCB0